MGSALAGAVCTRFGSAWAMGVDALSFGVSGAMLAFVQFRRDRAEREAESKRSPLEELASGFTFLVRQQTLRALTLFQTSVALLGSVGVGAAVIDILVYRLKVDFAETSSLVGASLSLSSLGAVLGAVAAGRLGQGVGLGVLCAAGTGLQGLGLWSGGLTRYAARGPLRRSERHDLPWPGPTDGRGRRGGFATATRLDSLKRPRGRDFAPQAGTLDA